MALTQVNAVDLRSEVKKSSVPSSCSSRKT